MLDLFFSSVLCVLAAQNAVHHPGPQPKIIMPQSNEYVCRDPRWAKNGDICDRQAPRPSGGPIG